jgi:toxin ParE1/3/4
MNIVWSPEAIEDLASLRAHIAEDNPAAARRVVLQITENVEQLLSDNPQICRAGRVPGSRELILRTPYIVPYRFQRTTIQILRVYHGARRWPDRAFDLLASRCDLFSRRPTPMLCQTGNTASPRSR